MCSIDIYVIPVQLQYWPFLKATQCM